MWVAATFAAIALTGTAFMVWFLFGLLRERAPPTWYWIVPIRGESRMQFQQALSPRYIDEASPLEHQFSEHCGEALEEDHAKACGSGLVALDIRPAPEHWSRSTGASGHLLEI
jgi:hypothetical protein